MNGRRVLLPMFFLLFWFGESLSASAQTRREVGIFPALVHIETSGEDSKGVPKSTSATGFVTDKFGHVVTVWHAIEELGAIRWDTLKIKLQIGAEIREGNASLIAFRDDLADILVLNLPTELPDRKFLCMLPKANDDTLLENDTRIYSSGFPLNKPFYSTDGIINAFSGDGNTWLTSLTINPGFSGSPIYTASGQVVGIAKGQDSTMQNTYVFIPLKNIRSQLANYTSECATANVNISSRITVSAAIQKAVVDAIEVLPTPTECVMVGKSSALITRKPEDAPFGLDIIKRLKDASSHGEHHIEARAAVDVNIRSNCPVVRNGDAYYGKITRVLKAGQSVVLSSYLDIPLLDDHFFWGQILERPQ